MISVLNILHTFKYHTMKITSSLKKVTKNVMIYFYSEIFAIYVRLYIQLLVSA